MRAGSCLASTRSAELLTCATAARDELQKLLGEAELAKSTVLVFANKQDLPQAKSGDEVATELGLRALTSHKWCAQSRLAARHIVSSPPPCVPRPRPLPTHCPTPAPTPACLSRYVQPCCATSGEGLTQGLDWLSKVITNKP